MIPLALLLGVGLWWAWQPPAKHADTDAKARLDARRRREAKHGGNLNQ